MAKKNAIRRRKTSFEDKVALFVFIVPALVLFLTFVVYPIIPELTISLQNHNGTSSKGWVGLDNYINIIKAPSFQKAQVNTLVAVAINLLIGLPISLVFALLMDSAPAKVRNFFKFASVLPAVLSITVIGKMWMAIYEPNWGLLNSILGFFGLENLQKVWLGDPEIVFICVMVAYFWQFLGLNALLFYTGIKAIPKTYYEAAEIDGAGFWRASFKITVPLLQDVTKYVITTSTMGTLGTFAVVSVMTSGGPGYTSRTLTYEMYYQAFLANKFGVGCAVAVIFIIESVIASLLINRFVAREKIEY